MKLENQVCSLELSKKLKELGVKQESLFYHCNWKSIASMGIGWEIRDKVTVKHNYPIFLEEDYSAFTVAELISMLQTVAKRDIIIALENNNVADYLAQQLIMEYAQKDNNNR
jgi:hypothetical protein